MAVYLDSDGGLQTVFRDAEPRRRIAVSDHMWSTPNADGALPEYLFIQKIGAPLDSMRSSNWELLYHRDPGGKAPRDLFLSAQEQQMLNKIREMFSE
jgi:hypothetical protein